VAYFSPANLLSLSTTFSPQNHHDLPSKNHAKYTEFRKTPSKNTPPPQRKKSKKKTPKPFCGLGAIGLQTARKPNSVLDDHSSTRRITAAL
jgi:hypothetical protein